MSEQPTKPKIEKPKLQDLEPKAKALLDSLKIKHKGNYNSKALDDAARHAYNVWHKAAVENTLTGAAQIDDRAGVTSMERYFLSKFPKK